MIKNTDVSRLLQRGVDEIIVREQLQSRLSSGKKITLYLGIDPTGSRLHLGHAIALRKLRDFQQAGHKVIFLIGDFTALIGDTSDKESQRQPMTPTQVEENFKTYKTQASKILDFSKIDLRYNSKWLGKLNFRDILELANKFTVQQMIEREMYQLRLAQGKPIGLHEFLYPLMQGYDSVAMDVDLEVGGRDQLFNMLAGRTLQKIFHNKDKHVMTMRLLEGTDGRKMSKTYNNVINITDIADEQYGKIMSVKDDLIFTYFELCTDVEADEIQKMQTEMAHGANPRDFKMLLAKEIVSLYHGQSEALRAEQKFIKIFREKDIPSDIEEKTLPGEAYGICDLLVETGLAKSKSEAKRLVEGGGVSIDEKKHNDPFQKITLSAKPILLKVGKRHFMKVRTGE